MLDVAIAVDDRWSDRWQADDEPLTAAVEAAIAAGPYNGLLSSAALVEVAIRLTDDAEVQALNAQWRGKDKPTNVLSFPQMEQDEIIPAIAAPTEEILLGDIVIAYETCVREASEKQISLDAHVTHLVVHGTLHLLGYDHIDDADALTMESLERDVVMTLGHADPYLCDGAILDGQ